MRVVKSYIICGWCLDLTSSHLSKNNNKLTEHLKFYNNPARCISHTKVEATVHIDDDYEIVIVLLGTAVGDIKGTEFPADNVTREQHGGVKESTNCNREAGGIRV